MQVLFRFRIVIFAVIFFVGFWAPWDAWWGWPAARVWLVVPQQMERAGWMSLAAATWTVTMVAVVCAWMAVLWRTWGTAYLHAAVVFDGHMHAEQMVADGPFRYVRNPLYLGTLFHALALAILMPVSGAIVVVVLVQAFHVVLVRGEERLLLAQRGVSYAAYRKAVARWIPLLRARVAATGAVPRWGQAVLGEIYMWAVAMLFAALAWRYNAVLLERGVLIAFGTSLVLRAVGPQEKRSATK